LDILLKNKLLYGHFINCAVELNLNLDKLLIGLNKLLRDIETLEEALDGLIDF
jgi:hypothetical protein